MRKFLCAIGLIFAFGVVGFAGAEEQRLLPSVISFGGTGPALVKSGGHEREIQVGMEITYGSVIKTGPTNTVTVVYPDGSLLAIDSNTEIEVQERTGGSQWNKLSVGQVRGSIEKAKTAAKGADGTATPVPIAVPKVHRFFIRTKAAVLGVRGTEFVMATDLSGLTTQVHTLEGAVDVASGESGLLSANATSVPEGQFIEATEQGLSAPQSFNREEFLNNLRAPAPPQASPSVFSAPGGQTLPPEVPAKSFINAPDLRLPFGGGRDRDDRRMPPDQNPEQKQEKPGEQPNEKKDEPSRKIRLLSFQAGAFYTESFYDNRPLIAASLSWNPTIPLPFTRILSARGHFGANFGEKGSLNNDLMVAEFQVFANAIIFRRFFGEIGLGEQKWWHGGPDAGLFTANVGIAFVDGGIMDRLFVGRSLLLTYPRPVEWRAGIGFSF